MKQDDIADGVIRLFPHEDKIAGFHIGFHAAGQNRRPGEPQQLRRARSPQGNRQAEHAKDQQQDKQSRADRPDAGYQPFHSRRRLRRNSRRHTAAVSPAVMAARRDGSGPPVAGAGPFCSAVISRRMVY